MTSTEPSGVRTVLGRFTAILAAFDGDGASALTVTALAARRTPVLDRAPDVRPAGAERGKPSHDRRRPLSGRFVGASQLNA